MSFNFTEHETICSICSSPITPVFQILQRSSSKRDQPPSRKSDKVAFWWTSFRKTVEKNLKYAKVSG